MPIKLNFYKFKRTINKVLQIGITDQDSEIESYAKYFTNSIAVLSASISFIYLVIYTIKYTNTVCFIYLFNILLSLFCLLLNHYGFRRLASLYILSLICFIIIFTSILGGFEMQIYPLLIVITLCSASILLSRWLALSFNIISFVVYVMAHQYSLETGPWLESVIMPNRQYVNFGFVIITMFIIARLILNTVLKYINSLQNALKEAKNYNKKIEKQNKRLEMFNTIAAHDLRTPTRQVISFAGMAKRHNNNNACKNELNEYLDSVSKAGHRMYQLIESISTLNTSGQEESKALMPINLSSIISKVEQSEIELKYHNVNISYSKLPTLKFRPLHLYLIFQNLMINAVKFNNSDKKIIKISSKTDKNNIFLYFEDNGIGIDNNFKDLIFKPFKKLHVREEYNGSGLGLYIVSDILNYYEGTITFSENNIGGSTFMIKLPITLLSNTIPRNKVKKMPNIHLDKPMHIFKIK